MNPKFFLLSLSLVFVLAPPVFAQSVDDVVILETSQGNMVIEFFPDKAPDTTQNFVNLAHDGFYDGTLFHRIIPGFMIQGGDGLSKSEENRDNWGSGNLLGYTIDAEFNDLKHNKGIISMARTPDPNSASSQFFIVHEDSNFLDGQYTAFGRIITQESFDTLEKIATLETNTRDQPVDSEQAKILSAKVVPRSEISNILKLGDPQLVVTKSQLIPSPEVTSGDYTNKQLGFSISFPEGWIVQEPAKNDPAFPVVAALAPETASTIPPNMYVTVRDAAGKSLDDWIKERKRISTILY